LEIGKAIQYTKMNPEENAEDKTLIQYTKLDQRGAQKDKTPFL
tara:strand:- start:32 stop:160 length:129 start_codon:yes stop_codon:yes gene_type:complete